MAARTRLTKQDREEIFKLYQCGYTYLEIAEIFGISRYAAQDNVHRYKVIHGMTDEDKKMNNRLTRKNIEDTRNKIHLFDAVLCDRQRIIVGLEDDKYVKQKGFVTGKSRNFFMVEGKSETGWWKETYSYIDLLLKEPEVMLI